MNEIRIALAGNPNTGKTTLFNGLTGANQYVGNWPGVTVEKKEGKLKGHKDVVITDLPGIYSLSPYTLEEVVARNYLIKESPDGIINIIDGTNLERNLYLTTQLLELDIPMVLAINMSDILEKKGDVIDTGKLSAELGCPVVNISALKGTGIKEAAEAALKNIKNDHRAKRFKLTYSDCVERSLEFIKDELPGLPQKYRRWYEIKLFERDPKILEELKVPEASVEKINAQIAAAEKELEDDAESIITNERYEYIGSIIKDIYTKKSKPKLTTSEKIDKVITNRILAFPIFAGIMFLVYYLSIVTVGTFFTDWVNDGVFKDGWHLFGMGTEQYNEAMNDYASEHIWTQEVVDTVNKAKEAGVAGAKNIADAIEEADYSAFDEAYEAYGASLEEAGYSISETVETALEAEDVPSSETYGLFVPSLPSLAEKGLTAIGCADWLQSLIIDGIIAGVGAVLGFIPQMTVLFILLAFLESCGYMARIAFVLDRIFRKFGLSGKSFIPILIGTGCGVPGVMASRTIENEQDRRMTIMTTTFIPCSAKLPVIAMISAALFHQSWWVAPSAYFIGIGAIIGSGIALKKSKAFAGEPAPFVMELPAYHWPTVGNIARSVWERVFSFIRKAGTIILLSSIGIWAGSKFGWVDGAFMFSTDMELENSILGAIGNVGKWIFMPLGFGDIKATIATIMGIVAKEEVVGVFGVLDFEGLSAIAGYSFLIFNLLCAPCFAAIGAIRREMNNGKWTWFAIGYQCGLAYLVSLVVYQFGMAFIGKAHPVGIICAIIAAAWMVYMIVRPAKKVRH